MATATPDVTTELFDLILDEAERPCLASIIGCTQSARWGLRCPKCKFDYHVCDTHRKAHDTDPTCIRSGFTYCDATALGGASCGQWIEHPAPWRPI